MDIKYEKLKGLEVKERTVQGLLPECVYPGAYVCFVQDIENSLSENDYLEIKEAQSKIGNTINDNDFYDIEDEINLNLSHITTNEAAIRYLNYVKEKIRYSREMFEAHFYYEYWQSAVDKVRSIEHWDAGRKNYRQFLEELAGKSNLSSGGYKLSDEELETHKRLKQERAIVGDPPFHSLLRDYLNIIDRCWQTHYTVEELLIGLNGGSDVKEGASINLDNELTANTHKLILLNRLGLFKLVYDSYRGPLGNVRFAKLIGTLLGIDPDPKKQESFRKSVDDYTTETFLKRDLPKTVERPAAIKKVDAFLAELGLLNLIDNELK